MKKRLVCCLHLILSFNLVFVPVASAVPDAPADNIYWGGAIYTMTETYEEAMDDSKAKKVEAVATRDGKVVFTGSKAEAEQRFKGGNTELLDLQGKTMLPGFVDPHSHFPGTGTNDLYEVNLNSPPLGPMESIDDFIVALKARADITPPGQWVIGWGYDDSLIKEMRHPVASDLDKASTIHPIYIKHISAHMGAANTMAMEECDIKNNENYASQVEAGNVPLGNGEPTGFLRETVAMSLIKIPAKTAAEANRAIERGAEMYLSAGVTTGDEGAAFIMPGPNNSINNYQTLIRQNRLPIRIVIHPLARYGEPDFAPLVRQALGWTGTDTINGITFNNAVPSSSSPNLGDDISNYNNTANDIDEGRLWFGNWKIIFDGSNQGYTGWFKTPGYYDPPAGSGREYRAYEALNFTPDTIIATVKLYHKNNHGVEVHGNGNAAIESIVTAFEEAVSTYPNITDRRHTIIHSQMSERQHVERMMGIYDNLKPELAEMYGYPADADGGVDVDYMLTGKYNNGENNNSDYAPNLSGLIKKQNLINSYYVSHTYFWGDRHRDIFMGPGRAKNMSPGGWSIYNRNIFNYHSDTPVLPMDPLRSMQSAVSRVSSGGQGIFHTGKDYNGTVNLPETKGGDLKTFWDYDQRVNRLMVLRALTRHAAYPTHLEDKIGVIKEGAYADFVILGQDPLTAPELEIAAIRVAATIVGDKVEYGYLPGTNDFANDVKGSYLQADNNAVVQVKSSRSYTKDEALNAGITLPDAQELYSIKELEASISGGASDTAILQFVTFGNGKQASSFALHEVVNSSDELEYGRPSSANLATSDGAWWFASNGQPTNALDPDDVLNNNEAYLLYFTLKDNGAFDGNSGTGELHAIMALGAQGLPMDVNNAIPVPKGSSSSGGCSMGGSAFGHELLIGACAIAVLVLRRRREQA